MFSRCVYSASCSDSDFIPEGKQNIGSMVFALNRFVKLLPLLSLSYCVFLKCYSEHLLYQDILASKSCSRGKKANEFQYLIYSAGSNSFLLVSVGGEA